VKLKTYDDKPTAGIIGDGMRRFGLVDLSTSIVRTLMIVCAMALMGLGQAAAQSGDVNQPKQAATPPADAASDSQRKVDDFAEAARAINGPAGNPECVWLGRRVVSLMWRDDLDTAFRHLDLYDRFGCPGGHIQATFRCLVRFGDPKPPDTLNGRVQSCWINPDAQPTPVAAATPAAPAPATPPAAATPAPAPATAGPPK
jgi:cell division septation protein DedD